MKQRKRRGGVGGCWVRCKNEVSNGVFWGGDYACIGVKWIEVMLKEKLKRKTDCTWRDLRVSGVLCWEKV